MCTYPSCHFTLGQSPGQPDVTLQAGHHTPAQHMALQCVLPHAHAGISPIVMSAGELESGNAGEPAKLIRQR